MEPGVELDILIAKNLFKYVLIIEKGKPKIVDNSGKAKIDLPNYSTNVDDAFSIIKYFKTKDYMMVVSYKYVDEEKCVKWTSELRKGENIVCSAEGKTLPHSICICALNFIEKKKLLRNKKETKSSESNVISINFKEDKK